jgi:putative SOS response-associated peptidase YedK
MCNRYTLTSDPRRRPDLFGFGPSVTIPAGIVPRYNIAVRRAVH